MTKFKPNICFEYILLRSTLLMAMSCNRGICIRVYSCSLDYEIENGTKQTNNCMTAFVSGHAKWGQKVQASSDSLKSVYSADSRLQLLPEKTVYLIVELKC